jgi:hypothetical protein
MSLEKILKILQIVLASGLIAGVDANKIKAIIEILQLIMEKEEEKKAA